MKKKREEKAPLPRRILRDGFELTNRFSWELRTSWAPTQSREAARSLAQRSASVLAKSSSPEMLASAAAALSDGVSFFLAMTLTASKPAPAAR